jgi:hypothetical protein
MGSISSGNFRTDTKTTIEACLRLDVRQLIWFGAVHPGARRRGMLHWPANAHNDAAATIEYLVDMTGPAGWVRLAYGIEHLGDEGMPITQMEVCIALTRTAVHFGGAGRLWFVCPQRNEHEPCGKRAQTLYMPLYAGHASFACTRCHGLVYRSGQSRWPTWQRDWPAITVQDVDRTEARLWGAVRRRAEGKREKADQG